MAGISIRVHEGSGPTVIYLPGLHGDWGLIGAFRRALGPRVRFVEFAYAKNEVTLEYDLAPEATRIVSDQGRLRQILFTFLSWAVSRSTSGQRVITYAELLEGPTLQVQIDDEGGSGPLRV